MFMCMSFVFTGARTVNFARVFSTMGELFIDSMISSPDEVSTMCTQHYLVNMMFIHDAFSALTLLIGRQEGHPACKKTEW